MVPASVTIADLELGDIGLLLASGEHDGRNEKCEKYPFLHVSLLILPFSLAKDFWHLLRILSSAIRQNTVYTLHGSKKPVPLRAFAHGQGIPVPDHGPHADACAHFIRRLADNRNTGTRSNAVRACVCAAASPAVPKRSLEAVRDLMLDAGSLRQFGNNRYTIARPAAWRRGSLGLPRHAWASSGAFFYSGSSLMMATPLEAPMRSAPASSIRMASW